jgi:DNA-binding transcriptional MerR regulator
MKGIEKEVAVNLQIGELADWAGVTTKAIRHYHEVGLLPEPPRAENGYRLYTPYHLDLLQTIVRLQALGLSLRQIQTVLQAANPDQQLRQVLAERQRHINDELLRLQQQQADIQALLRQPVPLVFDAEPGTVVQALQNAIRPSSSGLADIVGELDAPALNRLEPLLTGEHVAEYCRQFGAHVVARVMPHEHQVILWLERYRALGELPLDDPVARHWLDQLRADPAYAALLHLVNVPPMHVLPSQEEKQLQRLLWAMLFEQASPLQSKVLQILNRSLLQEQ